MGEMGILKDCGGWVCLVWGDCCVWKLSAGPLKLQCFEGREAATDREWIHNFEALLLRQQAGSRFMTKQHVFQDQYVKAAIDIKYS